jgi:hypothetical protein
MFAELNDAFSDILSGRVFKKTASIDQLLQQGECDVLGISVQGDTTEYFAVDVAFHEAGLNYGGGNATVLKVVEKCIRTAFCLISSFDVKSGNIIFAAPKVGATRMKPMRACVDRLNAYFLQKGYRFTFSLLCNKEFEQVLLQPTLVVSKTVADTSELFMRSCQLLMMFEKNGNGSAKNRGKAPAGLRI